MRNSPDDMLSAFDAPDGFTSSPRRLTTVTATQSLLLLNSDWAIGRSRKLAAGLRGLDEAQVVAEAYRRVHGRAPTTDELEAGVKFLIQQMQVIAGEQSVASGPLSKPMVAREGSAALLEPGSDQPVLVTPDHPSLPAGDFTVEAFVWLSTLYDDASVRPIAAQWTGNNNDAGWSLGVTSKASRYKPANLILQLSGEGKAYEVIASNIHLDLEQPYYVAVSVKADAIGKQGVTFYVQNLAEEDPRLKTAIATHTVRDYRNRIPLVIGGRHGQAGSTWHGLIDDVRITSRVLKPDELLLRNDASNASTVAYWRFEKSTGFYDDASGHSLRLEALRKPGSDLPAREAAVADLVHALLNSNAFLHID
jgi:hypothetical protein